MISGVFLVVMMRYSVLPALATFRECSVNISNVIDAQGGDKLLVDCMKGTKHRHIFTPQILPYGEHYYGWKFVPDIWGQTKYDCDFTWGTHFRRLRVWADNNWPHSDTTERMCNHCEWHVAKEGFWRMTGHKGETLPMWQGGWCNLGELTCVG
jgi:hypothetical protein